MRREIDLNADLGEGMGDDSALMPLVSSCNIACGGHVGDTESMRAALRLAKHHGVAAGAHPSYPDREGFGRRAIEISEADLEASLINQVCVLRDLAREEGVELYHLKPHGALYNRAAVDPALAAMVAGIVAETLPGAALVGPPGSELQSVAEEEGLAFIGEAFADRAYQPSGQLVPRTKAGAVLQKDGERVDQALSVALNAAVQTIDGQVIALLAQTICLHGDSPGAAASAKLIRAALETAGVAIRAPQ